MDKQRLIDKAKSILESNYLDMFTKPAPSLYPYQWNWDSGFIAMAYAHYNTEKALKELESLFEGQWSDGMVPQIVFHKPSDLYFPGPDFWQADQADNSPKTIKTSGITMPPVHGFVLRYIYEHTVNQELALDFVARMWNKVADLHRFLYYHRDPMGEGLPYIIHPWESGTDNSPIFDEVLESIDLSETIIPDYVRKDLQSADAKDHRPVKKDYDRYVYLVDLFRKVSYDQGKILETCPFVIQDPMFCSIISRSNKDMIYLGKTLGKDVHEFIEWDNKTIKSMNQKLWDNQGIYNAYDLKNDKVIEVYSNSGFIPLFGGIPNGDKAVLMLEYYNGSSFGGDNKAYYACPTHAMDHKAYDPQRYWRGPVWINLNWMIAMGFRNYGFQKESDAIVDDSLEMISRRGFFEYFDPARNLAEGGGYGTDNFSWTAAIAIIMIYDSI